MAVILGIGTPFLHDPAAALLIDGKLIAAAEEERFIRDKHAVRQLPIHAIRYCLREAGIEPGAVDAVAFPWSPLAYERHRWSYVRRCLLGRTGRAFRATFGANAEEIKQRDKVDDTLRAVGIDPKTTPIRFVEHHLAHASSAYHLSGWDHAAILTVDGSGELTATMFSEGRGGKIEIIREICNPDSLGFFYSTITDFLGFQRDDGEYKVMGMAPFGDPTKVDLGPLIRCDGSTYRVNDRYVWATRGKRHQKNKVYGRALVDLLGEPRSGDALVDKYADIAAATQRTYEEILLRLLETHLGEVLDRCGGRLCLAGGCALNVAANRRLLEHPKVREVFIQPAANDAGAPLGAATFLAAERGETIEPMKHAYYGPSYTDEQVVAELEQLKIKSEKLDDPTEKAAELLAEGHAVAWFQGRMEWGPRALGNRSIIGNPTVKGMADDINERIKFREPWRPFCPSILEEHAADVLGNDHPSPFMTLAFRVPDAWKEKAPEIVHVDGTARPQTVSKEANPRYHRLISRVHEKVGVPIVLNTSLNRRGEPMVCSPKDAIAMFYGCGLEHLFINERYIHK